MYTNSAGVLQYLLGSFLVVSPHSMGTEHAVSHHNKLKSIQRASLSNETVNDRRIISVNGAGTDVGRHDVYMLCYKTSTVFR